MPRKPIDYSKTVIYKICCKDPNIKDIYVGSTTDFITRKSQHKRSCNNSINKSYNYYVYQFIRENGGWKNWQMIMIKKYTKCDSKLRCLKKERRYVEKLNATLNSNIPGRTKKEWHKDNKENVKQRCKKYYEKNKEHLKQKKKEWYKTNQKRICNMRKEYREKNRDIINQKQNEKIKCICGSFISKNNMIRHRKTKKHLDLLQQQNQ